MTDRDQAKKIATRMFIAKLRRRRNLAKLTIEQKFQIVLRMQKIAREIPKVRESDPERRR